MPYIVDFNSRLSSFLFVFFFPIQIRNESRSKKAVLQAAPLTPSPPAEEAVIVQSPHDLGVSIIFAP